MKLKHLINIAASTGASSLRSWRGTNAFEPAARQPEKLLELYDFEACPYCCKVRQVLTELDLDAMIYPCPRGGSRFRPRVIERGGRASFPYLVDPNTGVEMYESDDIIDYLYETYGGRPVPRDLLDNMLGQAASTLAVGLRGLHGLTARTALAPEQPLELFSFESSPFSRPVRELLCELELPYILRNTGKGQWKDLGPPFVKSHVFAGTPLRGRNRLVLKQRTGRVQLPYLIDPNTGTEMYESRDIMDYLLETYAA